MLNIKCWFGHQWKRYARIKHRRQPGLDYLEYFTGKYNHFRVCLRCGKREKIDG